MADALHMDSQLVRASSFRLQEYSAFLVAAIDYPPRRQGLAASNMINFLAGAVEPITNQRSVNLSGIVFDGSPDTSDVGFLDLTKLELSAQMAMRLLVARHDQDTRRIKIETMNDCCLRKPQTYAGFETILVLRAATRHAQ